MENKIDFSWRSNKKYYAAFNQPQLAYLQIDIKPPQVEQSRRPPLNLSLVIDRSGSMKGEKIENVRNAVNKIIDLLNEDDILSVVAFNEEVELLIPSQPVMDKKKMRQAINNLAHRGGTAISKGMRVGLDELSSYLDHDMINRMILLTDGETYGDEDECCILAKEAAQQKIAVTALGVGDEWNDEIIEAIANYSQGKSDYIESPDEIVKYFTDEVTEFKAIVVQNATLTLRLAEGAIPRKVYRVLPLISDLGFSPISDRDITVDLHEITAEQGQRLLIELLLPPRTEGSFRLAQAELIYDIPSEGEQDLRVRTDLLFDFTKDAELLRDYDAELMNTVERVTAFNLQTRALNDISQGRVDQATQKLRAAATRLINLDETELATTALQEAERLTNEGKMSRQGTKKLRYETRKLTRRLESFNAAA